MRMRELLPMVEKYRSEQGFLPGALVVPDSVEGVSELLELMGDCYLPSSLDAIIEESCTNRKILAAHRIQGMGIRLDPKCESITLDRATGNMVSIRPRDMKEAYMPAADITNSLSSIVRAALALCPESDEHFRKFEQDIGEHLFSHHDGRSWENDVLPGLDKACREFVENSKNANVFLSKFFLCVLDFHWHCLRARPGGDQSRTRDMIDRALGISVLVRTLPEKVRQAYMDHIEVSGGLPYTIREEAL